MSTVFISYASQTRTVAQRVAGQLRALGYDVWWDDDLLPNRPFAEVIEERLKAANVVLVVWSEAAIRSQWVRAEADFAMHAAKLVQVAIGGVLPPMPFNQIQCADLSHWSGDAGDPQWLKVIAGVAALVDAPEARPASVAPKPGSAWARLLARGWPVWAVAVAAVVLVAGVGLWTLRARLTQTTGAASQRVAILPFDTLSPGQDARFFADGLLDEMTGVLAANQMQVVSRTESANLRGPDAAAAIKRLGAGLLLDGTVQETDGSIHVRVHLDDAAQHTVLWSRDFVGLATASDPLQIQVAAQSTVVAAAALAAHRAGVTDPLVVGDFVAAREIFTDDGELEQAEPLARQVVQRAPSFADGHGSLAMILAIMGRDATNDRAAVLRAEAAAEARQALALEPHEGAAYVALSLLRPNTDWRGREAALTQGLAVDQSMSMLPVLESRLLAQSGRLNAATERAREAAALEPLQPWVNYTLANLLFETGQTRDGAALLVDMVKKWPDSQSVLQARFWFAAKGDDPKIALALLDAPTSPAQHTAPFWREYLLAEESGRAADRTRAAASIGAAVKAGQFDPGEGMVVLTRLGDIDAAFAAGAAYADGFEAYYTAQPPYLFVAQTSALRHDPRFIGLAARIGLVDYWRATGKWPDFCAEPDLPYSCTVEAAKVAAVEAARVRS
ncbi:MAG: TIR domain-containing protein [Caulobacterales bacterium]